MEVVSQDHLRRFKIDGQRSKAYCGHEYSNEKTIMPLDNVELPKQQNQSIDFKRVLVGKQPSSLPFYLFSFDALE